MKITEELVGAKVRNPKWGPEDYKWLKVLYVGKESFFCEAENGTQFAFPLKSYFGLNNWELYEEPVKKKKIVRMAPALFKYGYGIYEITDTLYENADSARINMEFAMGQFFVKWPASDTMWVEVEVDDE